MKKFAVEAPKSLTELVAARLRQAIVDGEIELGELISEDKLAQSFGVSRTPVRDALTLLQASGLVEIRSKRGSYVFQPTIEDIQAICEFRVVLEVHAARLSSALARQTTLDDLRSLLAEMLDADKSDDWIRYSRLDSAFHEALFAHCSNTYVREAYGLMSGRIAALRTNLSKEFGDARERSLDEHRQIVEFFEKDDFDALTRLLERHVVRTVDAFRLASAARLSQASEREAGAGLTISRAG